MFARLIQRGIPVRWHRRIEAGFTLVELIVIVVIVGVLAVFVVPRFFDAQVFSGRGFDDRVRATLRYAQKAAIASRRNVCVAIAATTVQLSQAQNAGAAAPCTLAVIDPATQRPFDASNVVAPAGVTLSASAANFYFDALGKPNPDAAVTATVGGRPAITVERETGYVH